VDAAAGPPVSIARRSRSRVRGFLTASAAALLLMGGCDRPGSAVWLAPGATAGSLTFVLGRERGTERPLSVLLRVERCDVPIRRWDTGESMWIAEVAGASRVHYGESSGRVRGQIPAQPLAPGCYYASVTGPGTVVFRIGEDGEVDELPALPE
jgi:hypothetical protein